MFNNEIQHISMKFTGEFFVPDEKFGNCLKTENLQLNTCSGTIQSVPWLLVKMCWILLQVKDMVPVFWLPKPHRLSA